MKRHLTALSAGAVFLLAPLAVWAQTPTVGSPLAEARARLACGSATIVSAQYLPGGLLEVTCQQNSNQVAESTVLGATGLNSQIAVGALAVVGILAVIGGGDDNGTATTTTTTTTTYPGGD